MPTEKPWMKPKKCKYCDNQATKAILWAEGRAYIPVCDADFAKGKKAVVSPLDGTPDPEGIDGVYEFGTGKKLDLADGDISDTSTMVAFIIPPETAKTLAIAGGVSVNDLHVTITFNGDTDEDTFNSLVADLKAWAADVPTPKAYEGELAGIGTFAPGENGQPWWVPVDVPGLNTLHEQVKAVSDRSAPASEDHGYSPHMTLTYTKPGESGPEPVKATKVTFASIWVVRGNDQRVEIPLTSATSQTSVGSKAHGTLGPNATDVALAEEPLSILDLAERAKSIDDPELRKQVFNQIIDLSKKLDRPDPGKGKTKQGLPSYRKQGKWKHGFVPVDGKAVQSKAKGSPVAKRRIERIFGKKTGSDDKGGPVTLERKGGKVTGTSAARIQGLRAPDITQAHRVKNSQFEKNKVGRVDSRALRAWDDIPDSAKVVKNGKRYVVSKYRGEDLLTEWQGGVRIGETKNTTKYRTLTEADAADMTTAQLRKILKDSSNPKAAKKVAYQALQAKLNASVKKP